MPTREAIVDLAEREYLGNTLAQWAVAAGIFAGVLVALWVMRAIVQSRARRVEKIEGRPILALVLRLISRVSITLLVVVALAAATRALVMEPGLRRGFELVVVVGLAWQALKWGHVILDAAIAEFLRRRPGPDGKPDPALVAPMGLVRIIGLIALYALVLLLAAQNLGIEVTPLVAGLGVTGIAVALAVQNILGDLFSSLSIVLDKPFVVGDFIILGPDHLGTVEKIGLKTTRVRALSGEQQVFSNSELLASRIRNFKRMYERRVVFGLGVVYQTPPEKLERAAALLREAVQAQSGVRFDRAHFKAFGPSSLDFEIVYYVLNPDFNSSMDIQQAINLHIVRAFAAEGIEFAYPTQTLYLPQFADRALSFDREPSGAA